MAAIPLVVRRNDFRVAVMAGIPEGDMRLACWGGGGGLCVAQSCSTYVCQGKVFG